MDDDGTSVGIPEVQTKHLRHQPALTLAGEINGKRITAEADVMRVLSIHAAPAENED
jgi:hypothetical protein